MVFGTSLAMVVGYVVSLWFRLLILAIKPENPSWTVPIRNAFTWNQLITAQIESANSESANSVQPMISSELQ